MISWFVFDLGNVLIKLAYERVIERICAQSNCDRDRLIAVMEEPGGYRDLERGLVGFGEFHQLLRDRVGYKSDLRAFRNVWSDFFDGPVEGIEELLDRVRERYNVAFLSNSNEVHEEVIPQQFPVLFRPSDRFVFSHRFRAAKPDPDIYFHALRLIGAEPREVVYIDDLLENVTAAKNIGMQAYQFDSVQELERQLAADGISL